MASDLQTEALAAYLGDVPTADGYVAQCWDTAAELVAQYCGQAIVPTEVRDRAITETAAELYHRKNAPNGIANVDWGEGAAPMRVARDPMVAARPLLRPYLPWGLA